MLIKENIRHDTQTLPSMARGHLTSPIRHNHQLQHQLFSQSSLWKQSNNPSDMAVLPYGT